MVDLHAVGNGWMADGRLGRRPDIAEMPLTAAARARRGRRGQEWIGSQEGAVLSLTTTLEAC